VTGGAFPKRVLDENSVKSCLKIRVYPDLPARKDPTQRGGEETPFSEEVEVVAPLEELEEEGGERPVCLRCSEFECRMREGIVLGPGEIHHFGWG
jgi:hypothetical protein